MIPEFFIFEFRLGVYMYKSTTQYDVAYYSYILC